MLTSAFMNFFYDFITYFVNKLPDVTSTSFFVTAMSTTSGYISALHNFMPYITATLLLILGFDLIFEGAYFFFKIFYWILRRFPTQS